MNFKKMIALIELLALTGVMSVGFSTWVIVETNFPDMQVQVDVENIFDTNSVLEIKNVFFSDYNEDGFYTDFIFSSETSLTGYLEFDIEIDLSMCSVFTGDLQFDLEFDTFASDGSFDLVSESLKISRETITYKIGDSSQLSYVNGIDSMQKTVYDVVVAGVTVQRKKLNDSFEIPTTNRNDILCIKMKYGFKLDDVSFSNLVSKNKQLNKGISLRIFSSLGGE